jgi:hypothetical protein
VREVSVSATTLFGIAFSSTVLPRSWSVTVGKRTSAAFFSIVADL